MTRQGWAERKVNAAYNKFINTYPIKPWTHYAAQTLLAEHKRAVRVVEQEIEAVKNDQRTYRSEERCLILGSLETVLKGLQRGRE